MNDKDIMIEFAEKIGEMKAGLKSLKSNFDNHIKQHRVDRIMQWIIIGLQTLVIMFLSYLKISGKI
jgi:hypothetical protein